jgi:hypothetical protein
MEWQPAATDAASKIPNVHVRIANFLHPCRVQTMPSLATPRG